ncbi:MAG: tRNA pseudouridine(38-40) synthase TruA [Burkholderiales bacterium RIFCSPHIGHO2_01_FULL_63_240]|nr:MAG: tRNA pseudouridine(38-40) synthase TruA [Burkholderiales bacterium RIFCSPHIGHO2_01_FULL_63_240]
MRRIALGVSYVGTAYKGWQSQPGGGTVQDVLEAALKAFAVRPLKVLCAGRTDAGVHGINQVVHLDTDLHREPFSWVRGTNAFLPSDISVQWAAEVPAHFHARNSAIGRRYAYVLLESAVRPALESGRAGWVFRPLDQVAMERAAVHLIGEHDFSSFRSSMCQSPTPIKTLREIRIRRCGPPGSPTAYWRFDFEGQAFLHHMIRNIMGCLLMVGTGVQPPDWVREVREARDRKVAAPTFSADGLYFLGPRYAPGFGLPEHVPGMDWLPS